MDGCCENDSLNVPLGQPGPDGEPGSNGTIYQRINSSVNSNNATTVGAGSATYFTVCHIYFPGTGCFNPTYAKVLLSCTGTVTVSARIVNINSSGAVVSTVCENTAIAMVGNYRIIDLGALANKGATEGMWALQIKLNDTNDTVVLKALAYDISQSSCT